MSRPLFRPVVPHLSIWPNEGECGATSMNATKVTLPMENRMSRNGRLPCHRIRTHSTETTRIWAVGERSSKTAATAQVCRGVAQVCRGVAQVCRGVAARVRTPPVTHVIHNLEQHSHEKAHPLIPSRQLRDPHEQHQVRHRSQKDHVEPVASPEPHHGKV